MEQQQDAQAAQASQKLAAAQAAVAEVTDGAVVGLGSGSTAEIMLQVLAERVRQGLRVTGVATSERTQALAISLGIPVAALDDVHTLDVSIDGADEVLPPGLDLIKGLGGALLREKFTAAASKHRIIIVDATKLVGVLGVQHPVPVEVEPFGWQHTAARLVALGARLTRRPLPGAPVVDGVAPPFVTDGGHYLLDCFFGAITQPAMLAVQIKATLGVVEHGLFVGMTERVYLAGLHGVQRFDRAP